MLDIARSNFTESATAVTVFPMSGKDLPGGGEEGGGGGTGGGTGGGGAGDPNKVSAISTTCDCESVMHIVSTCNRAPLTLNTSHPQSNPSKASCMSYN
jgi:hypothetical protein